MDYASHFKAGLPYDDFLQRYGTEEQRRRWGQVYDEVQLTDDQRERLASFQRQMKVLCMAGAWCGDCVEQCPILARFAAETQQIQLRFVDRDDCGELKDELSVCGGARVPAVLFLSEDDQPTGRYGDRTLAKYRNMATNIDGAACSTGLVVPGADLLASVTSEWLDQFERNQLILRTSPRLRQRHGD